MFAKSIFAAAFMAVAVTAQSSTSGSGSATISTSAIAAEVSANLKASWCISQQSICSTLCGAVPNANICNPTSLAYTCTCQNGTSPGLQYYANTIDSYTCQRAYSDCVDAHPNDALGQSQCTTNIRSSCGTLNAASFTPVAVTASTTAAASSAAGTSSTAARVSGSSTTAAAASATTSSSANNVGKEFGFSVVGAGLFAAFGFML